MSEKYTEYLPVKLTKIQAKKVRQRARKLHQTNSDIIRLLIDNLDEAVYDANLNERSKTKLAHAAAILHMNEDDLVSLLIERIDIRFILGSKPEPWNVNQELRAMHQEVTDF